jgi:DNA polymerase I-like protein with 3'-5' exonuclease and polymerase domains
VCKEHGGVFYAEIHQGETATHRLSSTGKPLMISGEQRAVQFQNTPRTLKRLFKAKREGWLMAEPDGSQLEAKCAGFLSQDAQMLADLSNPTYDFHVFTASQLFNKSEDEVRQNVIDCKAGKKDSWRQLAKPATFKPLYGGSKGTPEQERYYAAFRARYPELAAAQKAWADEALRDKQYVTPWGLIYYFPTARVSKSGYANVTTSVYNYPIQALATAEITPIALVHLWHRIGSGPLKDKCFIVNTVHDSAPCELHPSVKDEFIETAKQCFTHDVYTYLEAVYGLDFNVPLGVGIKIGERWGVGEELSFTIAKGASK